MACTKAASNSALVTLAIAFALIVLVKSFDRLAKIAKSHTNKMGCPPWSGGCLQDVSFKVPDDGYRLSTDNC